MDDRKVPRPGEGEGPAPNSVANGAGESHGLSAREAEVMSLIADGQTNGQIAARLLLAEKTVKNYVSNLLQKMGFSRRTEAAVYAARAKPGGQTGGPGQG